MSKQTKSAAAVAFLAGQQPAAQPTMADLMSAIMAMGQRITAIEQTPPATDDSDEATDDSDEATDEDEADDMDALLPHNHPDRSPIAKQVVVTDEQREREQQRKQSRINAESGGYVTHQHETGNDIERPNLRKGKVTKQGTIRFVGSKPHKKGTPVKLCHAPSIDDTTRKVLVEQEEIDPETFAPRKGESVKVNPATGKSHVWRLKPCKLAAITAAAAIPAIPQGLRVAIVDASGKIVSDVGQLDVTTSAGGSIMLALPTQTQFALPIADDTGKGKLTFDAAFYPTASMFTRDTGK